MRPDEIEALAQRQWGRQNSRGLALKREAEDASRRIKQNGDAFREQRAGRNSADDVFNVCPVGKMLGSRRIGNNVCGYPLAYNSDEQRHEEPHCQRSNRSRHRLLKKQREEHRQCQPESYVKHADGGENKHAPKLLGIGRKTEQRDAQSDHEQENGAPEDSDCGQTSKKLSVYKTVAVDRLREHTTESAASILAADGVKSQCDAH